MKRNKTFPIFSIALIGLSAAFQPAAAAIHPSGPAEYPDSTLTLPLKQSDRITVRTSNINLTIRRWADSKAQLVVTAAPVDWKEDLKVTMRPNSNGIVVELAPKPGDERENVRLSQSWSSIKATLDIPDGHEFVLESSFANVEILSDFKMGNITVNNGELTASSIPRLELNAQFAKVHLNDCQTGKITLNNGELTGSSIPQLELNAQFAKVHLNACHQASVTANNTTITMGTVDVLQLRSAFSTIDLTTVNHLTLISDNDALSIADLGEATTGRKTFGSFRIGKLRKGFTFAGQNADISFGEIDATVDTLNIDDQFARLHIPLDGLPGFSLRFDGRFATVRSSLPSKPVGDQTELNHSEFTINKGAGSGKLPMVSLHCDNCEVDLESK